MQQNELLTTEIAQLPANSTHSVLRKSLALEALEDNNWILYYESVLAKIYTNIENTPLVSESSKLAYSRALNRIHEKNKKTSSLGKLFSLKNFIFKKNKKASIWVSTADHGRPSFTEDDSSKTSWGVSYSNVDKASLCFQARANEILEAYGNSSYVSYPELTLVDKISIIVAGELWLAANGASDFEQAASLGPGALGSYANILARSVGEPIERMPSLDYGDAVNKSLDDSSITLISYLHKWAASYLTEKDWQVVLSNCVTDLSGQGVVASRVYEFSRKIELYYNI